VQSLSKLAVAIAGWDTMSLSTKMAFVDGLKRVANMDAPGYPIKFGHGTATGTVIGHTSEGWVFTGQIPAGLAMHDIDPSMYEGAARFFFEGLLPVRQLAYKAHKHYQGSHYSYARYEHEIASAMIWNAIGANVFPPSRREAVPKALGRGLVFALALGCRSQAVACRAPTHPDGRVILYRHHLVYLISDSAYKIY
jgi:hypothetical protein